MIRETTSGVDVLPATLDLAAAEVELVNMTLRELVLKDVLAKLQPRYDHILIDCPPSLGLLTINALAAAHQVIIPLQCEFLATRGLNLLLRTLNKIQGRLNRDLKVAGILPTMFDGRTTNANEILAELRTSFPGQVYDVVIKNTVRLKESPAAGPLDPGLRPPPRGGPGVSAHWPRRSPVASKARRAPGSPSKGRAPTSSSATTPRRAWQSRRPSRAPAAFDLRRAEYRTARTRREEDRPVPTSPHPRKRACKQMYKQPSKTPCSCPAGKYRCKQERKQCKNSLRNARAWGRRPLLGLPTAARAELRHSGEVADDVWDSLEAPATITNSFRYTDAELSALTDVLYQIGKQQGAKLSKQDVARLGLNVVLDDYRPARAGQPAGPTGRARRRQRPATRRCMNAFLHARKPACCKQACLRLAKEEDNSGQEKSA